MTTKLKPCPFCACPAELLIEESTTAAEACGSQYQEGWIECPTCGATGPRITVSDCVGAEYHSYDDARRMWNSRCNIEVKGE